MLLPIKHWLTAFSLILFSALCFADNHNDAPMFEAGTQYEIMNVKSNAMLPPLKQGRVEVVEFFSYGCPACYRFEPTLLDWAKKNRGKISFQRVPVIFEPNWEIYARAYYLAKALKLDEKLSLDIFSAIQNQDIQSSEDLKKLFMKHHVSAETFDKAYTSPLIDSNLMQAKKLSGDYEISRVPTIIVGGIYKTDISKVDGDPQTFTKLLNFLVKQAMHEKIAGNR